MDFCHLHNHTMYSFLDGVAHPRKIVERAKELGMSAVAITDHGNMFGVVEFYKEALGVGVKPIVGCEVYIVPFGKSRLDRVQYARENPMMRNNHHLILLAKDLVGFKNISSLITLSYQEGFYMKNRIDFDILAEYSDGVICSSACLAGEVNHWLKLNKYGKALEVAGVFKGIFGEDFYLEVQYTGLPEQLAIVGDICKLSEELDVKMIVTNDCHYVMDSDAEVQHKILLLQQGLTEARREDSRLDLGKENYIKTDKEMLEVLPNMEDAILNTMEIADKCNLELQIGNVLLPKYDISTDALYQDYQNQILTRKQR